MDWTTIFQGGVAGVAVTAAFAFAGKLVGRNTTLTTARIDDREKWVKDLVNENRLLEAEIGRLRAREMRIVKAATFFAAHVESVGGIAERIADMSKDCGNVQLSDLCVTLKVRLEQIAKRIEGELSEFMVDPFKDVPSLAGTEPTKTPTLKIDVNQKKPED